MSDINFAEACRARCGAPARFIGDGLCLFISAMSNDLCVDMALPAIGGELSLPLPTAGPRLAGGARPRPGRPGKRPTTAARRREKRGVEGEVV